VRTLKKRFRTDVREFEALNRELAEFLDANAVRPGVAYAVHLAVEEMVLNVMKHAYGGNTDRFVDLALEVNAPDVTVQIEDDGAPFDPRQVLPPALDVPARERRVGGLGIHLVRSVAESLDYERAGERNRVRIRITPASAFGS